MCTGIRFIDDKGRMYFGRNLDWSTSYGEHMLVIPRNATIPPAFERPRISSIKTRAVIGVGIVSQKIPLFFDCANEDGLAIAGLNFPGFTKYASKPDTHKINVAAYEFPLWISRNFSCVNEVKGALEKTLIIGKAFSNSYPVSYLHWLVADKKESIVIECSTNGMKVYSNGVDVLTNQPSFDWQQENLRNYLNLTSKYPPATQWQKEELAPYGSGAGMRGLPGDYYSSSRFVRAAYLNAHYPTQTEESANVIRLFRTLSGVSMIDGAACMSNGEFERTLYTSGFSERTNTYYYSSYSNPAIKSVSLQDFDLDRQDIAIA